MTACTVVYGHYANYLNQMDRFILDNPDHPVLNVAYEEMKQVGLSAVVDG